MYASASRASTPYRPAGGPGRRGAGGRTSTVTLPAGVQTLTLDQDNGGWNIHNLTFALTSGGGISATAWYEVVNQNSGLCASAAANGTANGTAVEQTACTGATSQLWQFVPVATGYYEILNDNAQSEGESWNITGGVQATAGGDLLQTWNYGGTGNTNALFAAARQPSGDYTLTADNSGLCVDIPGASTTSGVQLQQYTCNSTPAQAFNLVQESRPHSTTHGRGARSPLGAAEVARGAAGLAGEELAEVAGLGEAERAADRGHRPVGVRE